ncbi:hypothetical protein ACTSKR_09495 [Chitinibacteraceae bacterium HSL-7]
MFKALALSLALIAGSASAGDLAADVSDCRNKSFWLDRDQCLSPILDAQRIQHKTTEPEQKRIAKECTAEMPTDVGSGSSVGTWQLVCQIKRTARATGDAFNY